MTNRTSPTLKDTNPQDTYFSMQFTQSSITIRTTSVRESLANSIWRFGGFIFLMLRIIGYILGAYQTFTFDNSLTKKLYSYTNEAEGESVSEAHVPEDAHEFKNNLIVEAREKRSPFRYTLSRFFAMKNFASPWCCCYRRREEDVDKLQGKARSRLYQELDIL